MRSQAELGTEEGSTASVLVSHWANQAISAARHHSLTRVLRRPYNQPRAPLGRAGSGSSRWNESIVSRNLAGAMTTAVGPLWVGMSRRAGPPKSVAMAPTCQSAVGDPRALPLRPESAN